MIVFVVVLINILQPISTLFPYTTLFRSQNTTALGVSSLGVPKQPAKLRTFPAEPCGQPAKGNCGSHRSMDGGDFRSPAGDRKSTRLYSSHVESSYAVFCFKNNISLR